MQRCPRYTKGQCTVRWSCTATTKIGRNGASRHRRSAGDTTGVGRPGGRQANSGSEEAAISADGRFVAFVSYASNLVAGDTNGGWDVFVRDRVAWVTRRVSVG
jgi:hypothetical protein